MTDNQDWIRVTTLADYLEKCADRYYGEEGGQSIALRHGQIYGDFAGQRLSGTWEWSDEFFSRTSTIGDIDLGHDRIVIEITDDQMRLTMNEGQGDQVVYDRKPAPSADTASADDIAVCSTFDIKPEGVDAFVAAMTINQQAVRAEPGNIEMRMFQEIANPSAFHLFGRSAGDAGEAHTADVEDRGIEAEVAPTINTPPIVRNLGLTNQGAVFGPLERGISDDELIVLALFDFKAGYRDRVLAQYDKQIPLVRADPASISFNAFTVDGEPDKLVVFERWANQAAAAEFSTSRPVSVETGALLAEAVVGDLPSYIHQVKEIDSYSTV